MAVSIVIPTRNRPAKLLRAVRSVLRSCDEWGQQAEVVVVDDGSDDDLRSGLGALLHDGRLRVLRNSTSTGPAAARNRGVRESCGDTVLFTDDDVVVDERWVRELATYLRDAPRRVAGVGGRVLALGKDVVSRYYEYHRLLDPFRLEDGTVLYVVTCNCAYRRTVLEQVGGFGEDLRRPGGEDPGLSFKVVKAGYQLHAHEPAIVWHDFRPGLLDFASTMFRYGAGCRKQSEQHGPTTPASGVCLGVSSHSQT